MGLIIDNFAGGGGASTGLERTFGRSPDAAINHDQVAIAMHRRNHPDTKHYCQSIWQVDPRDVVSDLGGGPVDLAWFSPDCKHFSKAKGGTPIKRNIRDLAWVVVHWAQLVKPKIIMLENVEEFRTWGPLCHQTNKAIKERAGETWDKWLSALRKEGYKVEWRVLRACDYGAPTIRKRLFLIARCDDKKIVWPKPTHGPTGSDLKPYRTAADCMDWSIPCPSIFDRPRPLAENTHIRLAKGLRKFVLESAKPFIVKVNHSVKGNGQFRGQDIDEPLQTLTQKNGFAVATPFVGRICQNGSSGHRGRAMDEPLSTITSKNEHLFVAPHLSRHFGNSIGSDCQKPVPTLTTKNKTSLAAAHVVKHYGGVVGCEIDKPAPTVTTRATQNQLAVSHMVKMRGTNLGHPTDEPLHTISAGGTHLGQVLTFLTKYYGTAIGADISAPVHSVTTKDRFGLVEVSTTTDPGEVERYHAWWMARWLEDNAPEKVQPIISEPRPSAIVVSIEGQEYAVIDMGMRMLSSRELFRAQGFPDTYEIDFEFKGKPLPKTSQTACCGNSVPPDCAEAISGPIKDDLEPIAVAAE